MAQARGPLNLLLSNSGAQWATVLGMGAYVFHPDTLLEAWRSIATVTSERSSAVSTPIIIHTSSRGGEESGRSERRLWTTLLVYTIGAGGVWLAYSLLTSLLPECVGEFLPVTRRVFDRTTKNLATSLFHVKEAMIQQVAGLLQKQDALSKQQEDMHRDVNDVQADVKLVRHDVTDLVTSVDRCESAVTASHALQSYTARGVQLLVAAVATVLPREDESGILQELEQYARDGEPFRMGDRATPPEQEHPRQLYSAPRPLLKPAARLKPTPLEHTTTTPSEMDFLTMIRNGTLVVSRP